MFKLKFEEKYKKMIEYEEGVLKEILDYIVPMDKELSKQGLKSGVFLNFTNYINLYNGEYNNTIKRPILKPGYLSNIRFYICKKEEDPMDENLVCISVEYSLTYIKKSFFGQIKLFKYGWNILDLKKEIEIEFNKVIEKGYEKALEIVNPVYEYKKIKNILIN